MIWLFVLALLAIVAGLSAWAYLYGWWIIYQAELERSINSAEEYLSRERKAREHESFY